YITTDQVANMIIQGDPSLMLVDVRSEEDFQKYSIQQSLNIPLENLLNEDNLSYFGIPGTKVVFVSEDDIKADQAWVLTKRLGFSSTYVMKGGMNQWVETIIEPKRPAESASNSEFEIYQSRKGAQLYFTGAKAEEQETSGLNVKITRKERSNVASGGC
ncbi:MAG: rhodanese-like domain-containing protein, partial [Prolixibacteraceae bacterium]|nr:rhodanese-like domain-containing protein [Prolixibacteraceae bacterium]